MGAGTRELRVPRAGSQFPSPPRTAFPRRHASRAQSEGKGPGRGQTRPLPFPRLAAAVARPESIFDGGGVPPSLPQITFATSSQPVGPKQRGRSDWGRVRSAPESPVRVPTPSPGRYILPSPAIYPSWKPSCGLAVTRRRNVASRVSRLDARLGWGVGGAVGGGTPGTGKDRRGGGVMRRGGTQHPPRPRAPAATRQPPPFLPREGQVFHTGSRDFKDQGFGAVQGLPRKGDFWKREEGRQALPWDQQRLRSCGKLKDPDRRSRRGLQPQAEPGF